MRSAEINMMNMFMIIRNKKTAIILLTAASLILIAGIVILYQIKTTKVEMSNNKISDQENEANAIKEANKEALNNVAGEAQPVKPISESDHYQGKLDAPAQFIIYSDFECPFYAEFQESINKIKAEFGEKSVIAFRHFPLSIHSNAMPAALASECADEQGKFWEMYDKLYADNKESKLMAAQFKEDAKNLELDMDKFNQCMETEKYKDKIYAQMEEGESAGVQGTPATFINGEFAVGAMPYEDYVDSAGNNEQGLKTRIEKFIK